MSYCFLHFVYKKTEHSGEERRIQDSGMWNNLPLRWVTTTIKIRNPKKLISGIEEREKERETAYLVEFVWRRRRRSKNAQLAR